MYHHLLIAIPRITSSVTSKLPRLSHVGRHTSEAGRIVDKVEAVTVASRPHPDQTPSILSKGRNRDEIASPHLNGPAVCYIRQFTYQDLAS